MSRTPATPKRRRAAASRWRCAAPTQARSRETVELFAQAAEDLLRTRPFEEISVLDIVRRAKRPIGSFYARFGSKEALLPFLYQRYHDGLELLVDSRLGGTDWETLGLEATIGKLVDFYIRSFTERRWLIRALALFARMRPESLPPDVIRRRNKIVDSAVAILMRHRSRIAHTDPEPAIRFGLFLVSSVARERLLFAEAPNARATPIRRKALREELIRAFHSYLTCEAPR